jgi:pentatricopeptide repeat protein
LGNIEEAENLMIKMNDEGIRADSLTYTLLINTYGCMGQLDCAFGVLKRMFDACCDPSHYTYSFLIKHISLTKTNNNIMGLDLVSNFIDIADVWKTMDFEIALDLFEKMLEHCCAPNANTYEKLIVGLCKEGRLEVAQRLYDHMRDRGISPSENIYHSLVNYCHLQVYGEATMLLDTMIEDGYFPTLESSKFLCM